MNRRDFLKSISLAAIAFPRFGIAISDQAVILVEAEKFKTKGGKNYVPHLDDFVDAYFVLETLLNHCS